ncbi:Probable receptor-like protein kinase At1g11050 [Linum perenne]
MPNSGARWFQGSELEKATNGFHQKNFLGKGAYGVVYKGVLPDGSYVAVKELHDLDSLRDEEFFNEVEIISKIRHRNLLSLRGCCATSDVARGGCCVDMKGKRRFLIYDFMANGSVADHLSNMSLRVRFSWEQRKNVILDVAKGLVYLHCGVKPAIYHRDIKASNILLDMDLRAKVADFGLARQGKDDGVSHITTRVAGTHGFLAPEYAMYGHLTHKSDVYSFGVLILEIVTAKAVIDTSSSCSSAVLITEGKLDDDGSLVAVKELLEVESFGNNKEFVNEVEIVSKIKHRNLLPLRGCCVDMKGRRRFLVYDFMANGSVADHLSNVSRRARLSWEKRKNIILDVAKGLVYLHCGVKPAIYHRDIKSSNILLDSDLRAKVADFGLARQGREDGYSHITTRVAGTHGFLAPEYAMYGHLSNKSDVYSFGVLVLEIMTARKVIDTSLIDSSAVLITDWVWDLVKAGRVEEAFDEGMKDDEYQDYSDGEMMIRFVMVGILCAHVVAAHRPTITEALKMLEGNTEVPKTPDRPLLMSR